jgi:hypothetical protein
MKENNKLIAEFIGMQHTDIGWYDNEETLQLQNNTFDELKYHKSWDWLMPVVDEIESIDEELQVFGGNFIKVSYSVQIENTSVTIWKHSDRFDSKRIIEVNGESKRRTTYNAVIEFINQYK